MNSCVDFTLFNPPKFDDKSFDALKFFLGSIFVGSFTGNGLEMTVSECTYHVVKKRINCDCARFFSRSISVLGLYQCYPLRI